MESSVEKLIFSLNQKEIKIINKICKTSNPEAISNHLLLYNHIQKNGKIKKNQLKKQLVQNLSKEKEGSL